MGKSELGAEFLFLTRHLSLVSFVVVSGEMKKAVEHQYFDFDSKRMAKLVRLALRRRDTYGKVTGDFEEARSAGGKRKNVCGFILAAELPVEAADLGVGCEKHGDLPAQFRGRLRLTQKASESSGGRNALVPGGNAAGGTRWPSRHFHARRGVGVQIWVEEDHRARGRHLQRPRV